MDKRVYNIIPQVIWIEMSKLILPSWLNIYIKCEVNLAVNASRCRCIVMHMHVFPSVPVMFFVWQTVVLCHCGPQSTVVQCRVRDLNRGDLQKDLSFLFVLFHHQTRFYF